MNRPLNISSRIAERYLAHTINLFRYDAALRRKLLKLLRDQVERALTAELVRNDPTIPQRGPYRDARVKALGDVAKQITRKGYGQLATVHTQSLQTLAVLEEEFARTTVNRVVGADLLTITVSDRRLREIAKATLIDGAPSANWWAGQAENTRKRFELTIRRNMAAGNSIGEMVAAVRGPSGVMAASMREAEALVRSSVLAVTNQVRAESFRKNADIIRGVQALVTMDSRTSETCIALGAANAAWDLEGNPLPESGWQEPQPPGPPYHWNCRTILVPVMGEFSDIHAEVNGQKQTRLDALPQAVADQLDGQLAASSGFETWLKGKSDTFQNDLLGKTKAGLWRDGKLKLPQLVDQSLRPLSIDQLKATVRGVTDAAIEAARAA